MAPMDSPQENDKSNNASIPFDLLLSEVITRLDDSTLVRCRCVCKTFCAWICHANPIFVKIYLSRRKQKPHLLLLSKKYIYGEDEHYKVIHAYSADVSTNGAVQLHNKEEVFSLRFPEDIHGVLCSRAKDQICFVDDCKRVFSYDVTTKELVSLPEWNGDASSMVGFGWTPSLKDHKVLRLFRRPAFPGEPRSKVFTLRKDHKWRRLEDPPFIVNNRGQLPCVDGTIYFMAELRRSRTVDRHRIIASFDVSHETFQIVPSPPCCLTCDESDLSNEKKKLTTAEGRLCLIDILGGRDDFFDSTPATSADFWVLTQGRECFWVKQYALDLKGPHFNQMHPLALILVENDKILLDVGGGGKLYYYDLKSKKSASVKVEVTGHPLASYFYGIRTILPQGI